MIVFLPLLAITQLLHWLGFLLDEILFSNYRNVCVKSPVFVIGVPRSGTTFLHRTLAQDSQFTTFSTWECLFAPSITERKLFYGLGQFDRFLGQPFGRLLNWIGSRVTTRLEDIHSIRLDAPEEDYLVFLPIMACFILVVAFPQAKSLWRMAFFDKVLDAEEKDYLMLYYKACLQKHLYVHGRDRQFLSKNASFLSLLESLRKIFPDSRIICCMRDPRQTVPSQLSSLQPGLKFFGNDPQDPKFIHQILAVLAFYYENALRVLRSVSSDHHAFVTMAELQSDLAMTVTELYRELGLEFTDEFVELLANEDCKAKRYVSQHCYSLSEFQLDDVALRRYFASIYEQYDFAPL